ncbi:MAG: Crp/Fnr family transcriptional regulator [Nitrincola lacisaponensis]|uniref:Crp/Fnr family transcriptional regulator n=1 Tax=Nitrincola lacisaponensis TaxID=267850 RepID=UPI00391CC4D9
MATLTMTQDPKKNHILAGLQDSDYAQILKDLEWVPLSVGQVLFNAGDRLDQVYFPTSGIISRVFTTQDGSSTELAMTGNDGLVGIPLILGGEQSAYKATVQSTGGAYRLRAETFIWELEQSGSLLQLSLAYVQALMTQIAQGVVCNRHHRADQQLCRWLLMSLDLLTSNQIDVTQEQIANMLGVRRECVTGAAGKLQAAGLIHYSRGHIVVIDRPGLEQCACECYQVVKSEYERLFAVKPRSHARERPRADPVALRQRAEKQLRERSPPPQDNTWDSARLIHELQVHQIELEMNNEEIRRAYDEADALRAHYVDVYDFAPVPYLTLDAEGAIIEMNLAAAILLCIKRSHKGRHHFHTLLIESSLSTFNHFLDEILNDMRMGSCEVSLKATKQHPETRVKLEGVPDEAALECRVIMLDIQHSLSTLPA